MVMLREVDPIHEAGFRCG